MKSKNRNLSDSLARLCLQLFFIGLCTLGCDPADPARYHAGRGGVSRLADPHRPAHTARPGPVDLFLERCCCQACSAQTRLHSLPAYRKLWLVGAFFVAYVLLDTRQRAEQLVGLVVTAAARAGRLRHRPALHRH